MRLRALSLVLAVLLTSLVGCGGGGGGNNVTSTSSTGSTAAQTTASPTPTPSATPTPTPTPNPSSVVAAGLAELNAIRALAGLPALAEDPTLTVGDQLHAVYMVKNNVLTHGEDPNNPFFTAEGNAAGLHSNVFASTAPTLAIQDAIDVLMVGPFHGLGFIDPRLQTTGIGLDAENLGNPTVIQSAAAIDVISGLAQNASVPYPVLWPGSGSVSPFASFNGNETPDPLTSLPGFTPPTGAPIFIQLGPGNVTPAVTSFSVRVNGTAVPAGEIDETDYVNPDPTTQATGRSVLGARSAIVILPRQPLPAGATVSVSVTTNGQTIAWIFTVSSSPH
jgi:uncharacterized protein YkwD